MDDIANGLLNMVFWTGTLSLSELIIAILSWILLFVLLMALIYLVWAGYTYITAGGDAEKAAQSKKAVIGAVIGLVICLSAYMIVQFIANGSILGGPS